MSGLVILRLFDMLSAIYFDYQLPFSADKINYIFSDRLLSSELIGFCLSHAQPLPQKPLGIGRIPAQFSRLVSLIHPSPQPSPARGEGVNTKSSRTDTLLFT